MNLFWDTSAILAMALAERYTGMAQQAWGISDSDFAWRWMRVEAEGAMARRNANRFDWESLQKILGAIDFLDLSIQDITGICAANRIWRLRAADAGHLYCFHQALSVLPDIQLVCFDDEMVTVARNEGFRLWRPPEEDAASLALVRETRSSYGRKRKRAAHV